MALMIVLWLLILRGVAIEFRSHQDNPLWREFWDTVFSLASALLAVVFGATLGNLVRGCPARKEGLRGMPLFTNFLPGREPGILDWYTGLVGLFTLAALAVHGALYLGWRTTGPVRERSLAFARDALEGRARRSGSPRPPPPPGCGPSVFSGLASRPWASSFVAMAIAGAWGSSGSRSGAVSWRRSCPRRRSCSGCWPRPRRAITRSGCGRPSTPPYQPHGLRRVVGPLTG